MKSYYALRIASWLSSFVPVRMGYWLASLVGGIVFYLAPSIREAVMDNMRHVLPKSTQHQRRTIARKVIRNHLKNYYDLIRLPHMKTADLERIIPVLEGKQYLDEAVAAGKGVIAISGHIGNFSIVAQLATLLGYKVGVIAEDIEPVKLYDFVNHLRGRFGIEMIKMGTADVRAIFRYLREGGMLMLAADRDVSDAGQPVLFFDAVCDMPAGPVVLAQRLKVPLVPGYTYRRADNTNIVRLLPPIELQRTGDHDADLAVNLRKVAEFLEGAISRAPDQWTVLQRVWDKDYTALKPDSSAPSEGEAEQPVSAELSVVS